MAGLNVPMVQINLHHNKGASVILAEEHGYDADSNSTYSGALAPEQHY